MRLSDFKRAYTKKRLFILGNGPSLNETPLEKLDNEYTFAMNNISTIYDMTSWRPTFYYNITYQAGKHSWWFDRAKDNIDMGITSFIRKSSPLPDASNVVRVKIKNELTPIAEKLCRHPGWSYDAENCLINYRMSAYSLTQLAVWMGFNPIYFLGMDLSFSRNPEICHFTDKYEGSFKWTDELVEHENYWHKVAHEWIKHHAELYEVQVYNATVGGNLEVYPRRDINDILC
jgi:hypothetical protein